MKTFKFNLKVSISDNWIEDGWNENVIKAKLQEFIEMRMNPYAYSHIEFVADIEFDGIAEDDNEGEIHARKCSFTFEGMNEGWVFGGGEVYAKYEHDAIDYAKKIGYEGLQSAYDDDAVYWTEWEDEDDFQYIMKDGKLTEI
jgi:hypothetical protein